MHFTLKKKNLLFLVQYSDVSIFSVLIYFECAKKYLVDNLHLDALMTFYVFILKYIAANHLKSTLHNSFSL